MIELLAAFCLLGAAYCLGGLHGLWLAWTQEERMRAWAWKQAKDAAVALQIRYNDGEGIPR